MRKVTPSGFDAHLQDLLKKRPALARAYAARFAELPVGTQLSILRRRKRLSQKDVAGKMGVAQAHVARMEREEHDPRLSSLMGHARAVHCRLLAVPDALLARVARVLAEGAPGT